MQSLGCQEPKYYGQVVGLEKKGNFVMAWLLLKESDRQAHLLNGLKQACEESSLLEDSRAMCPEVKISSLLK
jgi:hypothetical protein